MTISLIASSDRPTLGMHGFDAKMRLNTLQLSLQFGDLADAALHRIALPRHKVARWIRHALAADAEITVRIVGLEEGRALNRDYRQKDYATNVLTFDYTREPLVTADLVRCAPVPAQERGKHAQTLQAHSPHLLAHGPLHAQGWDHETSRADAEEMEAYEIQILARLNLPNPYS